MTTEQHLKIIRAKCVELLEASIAFPHDANKAAEAGWKSTIAVIDGFNYLASWDEGKKVGAHFDEPCAAEYSRAAIQTIISAWPEELLT